MHAEYDRLTKAYNLSRNTRDADRWTAEEWIKLSRAYGQASHDFTPCQWSSQQIKQALRSSKALAPQWDNDERPIAGIPLKP